MATVQVSTLLYHVSWITFAEVVDLTYAWWNILEAARRCQSLPATRYWAQKGYFAE